MKGMRQEAGYPPVSCLLSKAMKKRKEGPAVIRLWAVAVWLLVWQAAAMLIGRELLLPSPVRVLLRLSELVQTPRFWQSAAGSLQRISLGFTAAGAAGTLLAALAARFRRAEELITPAMLAVRTVPVASFIILALIWFSAGNLSLLISFLMVLPVLYTNVLSGIRTVDPQLSEMARVFRIPLWRRIRCVLLPQVMPSFRAGLTLGLGLCWKSGIAAEVIGMPRGTIGERLQQAKVFLETADVFAWTVVIVGISVLFERLVLWLAAMAERRLERV